MREEAHLLVVGITGTVPLTLAYRSVETFDIAGISVPTAESCCSVTRWAATKYHAEACFLFVGVRNIPRALPEADAQRT